MVLTVPPLKQKIGLHGAPAGNDSGMAGAISFAPATSHSERVSWFSEITDLSRDK